MTGARPRLPTFDQTHDADILALFAKHISGTYYRSRLCAKQLSTADRGSLIVSFAQSFLRSQESEIPLPQYLTRTLKDHLEDRCRWNGRGLRARDTALDREVAIKLLQASVSNDRRNESSTTDCDHELARVVEEMRDHIKPIRPINIRPIDSTNSRKRQQNWTRSQVLSLIKIFFY